MKFSILVWTLTLLLVQIIFQSDSNSIRWSENYKLSWDDFKGNANLADSVAALSNIVTLKEFERTDYKLIIKIQVEFNRSNSWVKPEKKMSTWLLIHEQGHFNLCELLARRMRKRIVDSKFIERKYKSEIDKLFKEFERESDAQNELYDKETNYSKDTTTQTKWLLYIDTELLRYNGYTNVVIVKYLNVK
ncbi:MAG: hypothetical protein NTU44_16500 [Bacteroidetes bacterium]|nr:hypothetical protein [Bacteroidota bacterium]